MQGSETQNSLLAYVPYFDKDKASKVPELKIPY
jgi:hypothetical protein